MSHYASIPRCTYNNRQWEILNNSDKTDTFIVKFPHMSSNIPSKPAYGVYISQLVRIGRICNSYVQFTDRYYRLTEKLIAQRFWYSRLCLAFKKFSQSHASIFSKYKCSVRKHIEDGICLPATDVLRSRNVQK